jgi:zinc/manganese transport system permease protein
LSGFFSDPAVQTALVVGTLVALVSGPVGVFTILRGQSFAGHSLADTGTVGGSGAYLIGVNVLAGFVALNVIAASIMEVVGARRARSRDTATGIVLGAALGLSSLFLHLQTESSTTGATMTVLFGSIFNLGSVTVWFVAALAGGAVVLLTILYRPLLLSSLSPELARARGVPVGLVGAGYLVVLALAVSLSAVTIGAVLSTALLIGPAATALRMSRRPGVALAVAAGVGVAATWAGIALSYDSYHWSSQGTWPVSFFVVAAIVVTYVGSLAVRH